MVTQWLLLVSDDSFYLSVSERTQYGDYRGTKRSEHTNRQQQRNKMSHFKVPADMNSTSLTADTVYITPGQLHLLRKTMCCNQKLQNSG